MKLWNLLEAIIHFFLYKVFRLKLSEENYKKFLQFVQFALVGVSNSAVYYVLYLLIIYFTPLHYELANLIAFLISVLNAYYWNTRYVFKDEGEVRDPWWKTLLKTYLSYVSTGLILGSILLYLWIDILSVPAFLGPVLNICITTPMNFVLNKFWAYRGRKKKGE